VNNNHLIVDEEIRPIIKLIFRLALEGHGCPKIASILTEKGIFIFNLNDKIIRFDMKG